MGTRPSSFWGSQMVIIVLFVILFSILFSLSNALYANYQYDIKIREFEEEIQQRKLNNEREKFEAIRYQLPLVIEKNRRETNNEIYPGEQVIVLHSENQRVPAFEQQVTATQEKTTVDVYKDLPNIKKWWYYFFE